MPTLEISKIEEKSFGDVASPSETRGLRIVTLSIGETPLREIPNPLQFAGPIHPALRVEKPFTVLLARDAGRVTAEVSSIGEFGVGTTMGEAVDDLGKTIGELYFSLKAERERLSPDLKRTLETLENHLREVR